MKKILVVALCVMCFAGSVIAQKIGDRIAVRGTVVQASSDGKTALVMTDDYQMTWYVESTDDELFYDGKKINKSGKFDGVYSYETTMGITKTVPKVIF